MRINRFTGREVALDYAVFSKAQGSWQQNVHTESNSSNLRRKSIYLELAQNERVELPAQNQLGEIIDGKIEWRDFHVELEEFNDFLASCQEDRTLNVLVEFVTKLRARRAAD